MRYPNQMWTTVGEGVDEIVLCPPIDTPTNGLFL